MKKILFLSLLPAALFSLAGCGSENENTISGRLLNAANIPVYIERITDSQEEVLDSARTDKDGNFTMNNPADKMDYYVFRAGPRSTVFLLLKGGEKVTITGDANALDATYDVEGSEDSKAIQELKKFDRALTDSLNTVYSDIRQNQPLEADSSGLVLQMYYTETMDSFAQSFIRSHHQSIASLSAMKFLNQQTSLNLLDSLEKSLTVLYPGNLYVKDFSKMMVELHKLPAGSEAPEILLPTPEGTMLSLHSFRGKVVLVDFWASWCGPCRKENPFVVSLYKKYHPEGFEIFGISLDDNATAWKEAIKKDGITWPQVSDLKKWNSECVRTYGVDAIPFSVLLDREGNIVAKGLRGADLEQKIKETLLKSS
ncbi:MAG: AhpC/TSA family protein [Bacteroidia bacterium]|nr:AhpC/TSA family protein [Bacteroidia bacterium]